MSIRMYKSDQSLGIPVEDYESCANSMAALAGDVFGLTTGGLWSRRTSITSGGGVWGINKNDVTTDANGFATTPAAPTGVNPATQAHLAITQYADRLFAGAQTISGVTRSLANVWLANNANTFIQRHKKGTRCNNSIVGKLCDLVWNSTTLEFEVDTTTTTLSCIVVVEVPPTYADNLTKGYYDSASFASDAYGPWCAFKFVPAFQAQGQGLRY